MRIRIKNISSNSLPAYETVYSAGMDVRAYIKEPIVLKPLMRCLVPTGLFIELPVGFEAQIRPRSGLAHKFGVTVLNSPGTIDADYRGEVKVILINLSVDDYTVNNGDRICQMVIKECMQTEWEETDELNNTSRGSGGFGHTGND